MKKWDSKGEAERVRIPPLDQIASNEGKQSQKEDRKRIKLKTESP
jgi:hypothetical protein